MLREWQDGSQSLGYAYRRQSDAFEDTSFEMLQDGMELSGFRTKNTLAVNTPVAGGTQVQRQTKELIFQVDTF